MATDDAPHVESRRGPTRSRGSLDDRGGHDPRGITGVEMSRRSPASQDDARCDALNTRGRVPADSDTAGGPGAGCNPSVLAQPAGGAGAERPGLGRPARCGATAPRGFGCAGVSRQAGPHVARPLIFFASRGGRWPCRARPREEGSRSAGRQNGRVSRNPRVGPGSAGRRVPRGWGVAHFLAGVYTDRLYSACSCRPDSVGARVAVTPIPPREFRLTAVVHHCGPAVGGGRRVHMISWRGGMAVL